MDSATGTFEYPDSMSAFRSAPFVTLDQLTAGTDARDGDEIAFRYRSDAGDTVRQGHVLFVAPNLQWVKILTARNGHAASFRLDRMTSGIRLLNKAKG